MRINRHRPHLCTNCQAPLRSRAGPCWHCDAERKDERTAPLKLTPHTPSVTPEKKAA